MRRCTGEIDSCRAGYRNSLALKVLWDIISEALVCFSDCRIPSEVEFVNALSFLGSNLRVTATLIVKVASGLTT